jgi:hypothetical protein
MDEILKKLLESDVLSEETKAEISAQFKTTMDSFLAEQRAAVEVEVRTQLTEEFVKAREQLAESIDAKLESFLKAEFDELKEDINQFRDLEVEYAEKLVEEKETLATKLGEQLDQLVDKIDAFLEVRLDEEMTELKEEIEEVKKLEFGREIFESMEQTFKKFRKDDSSKAERALAEAQDKLADATAKLAEIERTALAEARTGKLEGLLAPLSGIAKEQMKILLQNVATEKLDEAYSVYVGRVIKEASVEQKKVVVESAPAPVAAPAGELVTGNEPQLNEEVVQVQQDDQVSRLRKLAGLK